MEKRKFRNEVVQMEDKDYFGNAEVTNSDFRLLKESALHLKNKDLFQLSGANLTFGSAVHCYILEPKEFDKRYATESFEGCNENKNSKIYKEAKANWLKSVGDKEVISTDDFEKIKNIGKAVQAIAGTLLKDGEAEVAMFAEINDVQVSGKADYINHKIRYIFDVKTTQDIEKFDYSLINYGYITQAPFYKDIYKRITGDDYSFAFILVESNPPHNVRVATASKEVIEIGRMQYGEYLQKYVNYRDHGILELEKIAQAPDWYLKRYGYGTEL